MPPVPGLLRPHRPRLPRVLDAELSTLLVGYPKWKVDADSGKFPSVKIPRFVSSRTQKDTLGGKVNNGAILNLGC